MTTDVLERHLGEADLVDAVRVLEAGREHLVVPITLVRALIERAPVPHDVTTAMHYSRLIAACTRHVPAGDRKSVFGAVDDRACAVAAADPWTLDVTIDAAAAKIRVKRLLPIDSTLPPAMEWDIPRANAKNILNTETVGCLERLVDACPEVEQFEITTLTASGTPHLVADHEPAHKNMARGVFPDRSSVRKSVGYQAALRRATASQTWTEVVVAQIDLAAELTALAGLIPIRFKTTDNAGRRSEWRRRLVDVRARLTALDPPPMARGAGAAAAEAHHDDADRTQDATTRALSNTADALDRLCPEHPADAPRPLATAMNLRSAVTELGDALAQGRTVLDHLGSPIPDDLINNLERAANLAAALQAQPAAASSIRVSDPLDSADEIWERIREEASARSRSVLVERLASIPSVEIQHVPDPEPVSWSIDGRAWLITAAMENLDAVSGVLEGLDDEERDELGTRLVVLAVGLIEQTRGSGVSAAAAQNTGDPGAEPGPGAASSQRRRVCLDAGFQLSSSTSRPSLPLTPEILKAWAESGGVPRLRTDPASPIAVLEALIVRSVNAALSRMRQLTSPASTQSSDTSSEEIAGSGSSTIDSAGQAGSDMAKALEILEEQVTAEEAGNANTTLAGLALSAVTGGVPNEDEEVLLHAMALLHFARYVDLGDWES